jgi:citrate synthase
MAHWREAMNGTTRIWRPQQLYIGKVAQQDEE